MNATSPARLNFMSFQAGVNRILKITPASSVVVALFFNSTYRKQRFVFRAN
jgi:hypothetical protein